MILIAGRDFMNSQRTLSEADGGFRIAGLQEGNYTLRASKEGYATDPKGTPVTLAGASASGLEVRLSGGGTVSGRLTGLEFSQLSRVQVSAQFLYRGRVDPEGNYQIQHLPPGSYTVTAVVPDTALHAEGHVTLAPGAAEAKLDLQFGNGHTLTGVVLSNGEPLAGASLYLTRTATGTNQSAISDHEGGFRFGGLDDGHYDLDVSTPRGAQHRESVDLAGDRTIRVELRTASLAGRAIDATDGSPVSGAEITLQAGADRPPSFNSVTTDARGAFRLLEVGDGAWTLRATHEGYAPAEREVRVDGSAADDVEIRLDPTQGITIDALLANGQPPDRLRVAAIDAAGRTVVDRHLSHRRERPHPGVGGAAGELAAAGGIRSVGADHPPGRGARAGPARAAAAGRPGPDPGAGAGRRKPRRPRSPSPAPAAPTAPSTGTAA